MSLALLMHPMTLEMMVDEQNNCNSARNCGLDIKSPFPPLGSMRVITSRIVPQWDHAEEWEPPEAGRFCSLCPEDECWARHFGIGSVKRYTSPWFRYVDDKPFEMASKGVLSP